MRPHFWNKRQKIDHLLTQLASYYSVLAIHISKFKIEAYHLLAKITGSDFWYFKKNICMCKCVACQLHEHTVYILVLVSKAQSHVVTTLPFKNFSSLHEPCTKFSNLTKLLWGTHFCIGEISETSFLRLWNLNRGIWLRWFCQFSVKTFRPVGHFCTSTCLRTPWAENH